MTAEYLQWAADTLGVTLHAPISLQATGQEERGMVCSGDVPANSMVLSVPFDALLTTCSLRTSPLGELLPSGMREDDVLALLLLHEIHVQGEASRWSKHLELLPSAYHSLPCFTDDEMQLLEGTALHVIGRTWQQQLRNDVEEVRGLTLADGSKLGDAFSWLTFDRYRWALCTIFSRFVTVTRRGQQYKAMGPVFDMFNHDPASSTMHGFQDASDCLHIFTPRAWSAGQELFINYGPLSNTHLSMFYGFAVPNNQFDHVDLWATMSPETPSYELKQAVLLANGLLHDQQPFKLYADRPPTDIIQALRVQHADFTELSRMRFAFKGLPLSRQNEDEVLAILESVLLKMSSDIAGSQADDLEQLKEWGFAAADGRIVRSPGPEQRRERMISYRHGQRSIIQKAVEYASSFRAVAMPRATLSRDLMDDRVAIILVLHPDAAQRQPNWARECIEQARQQGLQNILLKSVPFDSLPEDCLDYDDPANTPVLVMAYLGEDAASAAPALAEFIRSKLADAGTVANLESLDEMAEVLGKNIEDVMITS